MKPSLLISLVLPYSKDSNNETMVWLQPRKSLDELNGLMEIPGGKIEKGENPQEAGKREFLEEVGVDLSENKLNLLKVHHHSKESIVFYIFGVELAQGQLESNGWFLSQEALSLDIPAENEIFMKDILKTL